MRFLKLLDPYELAAQDPGAVGRQQARARERFPSLVRSSPMHLWISAEPVADVACRLVIGVTPGFDLLHLRLLDLICQRLERGVSPELLVEVFDIESAGKLDEVAEHFPRLDGFLQPPIVGIWRYGVHDVTLVGFEATAFLLHYFDLGTPQQVADSVRPPTREMIEG
jgi:hypothetical protein